jgi:hypothetical protein
MWFFGCKLNHVLGHIWRKLFPHELTWGHETLFERDEGAITNLRYYGLM